MQNKVFVTGYAGPIIELLLSKVGKGDFYISVMEDDKKKRELLKNTYSTCISSLSFDEGVGLISNSDFTAEIYIGVSSTPKSRLIAKELFETKNITFPKLIQPSAKISISSKCSKGIYIGDFVTIESNATLHDFSFIHSHSHVGHDSYIGKFCVLGGSVTINGNCIVEDYCFLGSSVTVINDRKIGKGSVIAAGTCVTRDIPPFSYACGNPSKIISPVQVLGQKYILPEELI